MLLPRASAMPLTIVAALLCGSADARQSDRLQEVVIDADGTVYTADDSGDGDVVLSGNVMIEQGTLKIESDTGTVKRRNGEIRSAVLTGSPVQVRQTLDDGTQMQARAQQIDYDLVEGVVLLTGNVFVTQPQGDMRGERVRYDLKTGRLEGGGNGAGRIKMRLQPRTAAPDSPAD